jgi:uncharacterized damage-inducible protein DinB
MTAVKPWFERKFDFSFPTEIAPSVAIRLRGTPARMEELLRDVPEERLTRKEGGKWSAKEHAGHLLDVEPLWMARITDFSSDSDELTAADLSNRKTHEANHNARPIAQILSEFRTARASLLAGVDPVETRSFGRSKLHPRLKMPMRLIDHLFFVAEHDDHHLAIIWELVNR